jgi:hypothetical protein
MTFALVLIGLIVGIVLVWSVAKDWKGDQTWRS